MGLFHGFHVDSGSIELLARLFGTWIYALAGTPSAVQGQESLLVIIGSYMTDVAMYLFGVILVYVLLMGVARTAQDGEFLGKKWDSAWVPFRTGIAIVMLAPVAFVNNSQITAGQYLTMWVTVKTSLVNDDFWSSYGSALQGRMTTSSPTASVHKESVKALIADSASVGACIGRKVSNSPNPGSEIPESVAIACHYTDLVGVAGNGMQQVNNGWGSASGTLSIANDSSQEENSALRSAFNKAYTDIISEKKRQVVEYYMQPGVWETASPSHPNHDRYFKEVIDGYSNELWSKLNTMATTYNASVSSNFTLAGKASLLAHGWVSAGNYYLTMSAVHQQAQQDINAAIDAQHTAVSWQQNNAMAGGLKSSLPSDDFSAQYNSSSETFEAERVERLNQEAGSIFRAITPEENPIVFMQETGEKLGVVATGLAIGLAVNDAAQSAVGGIPVIGGFLKGGLQMLAANKDKVQIVMYLMMVAAIAIGTVVPAMPWFYFMLGVIQWLMHVAEMYLINPLWAAAHSAPEGQEHTSNLAAKGYNNILYIAIYPMLLIAGFALSIEIMYIAVYLLSTFVAASWGASGVLDSVVSIVLNPYKFIGHLLLLGFGYYVIVHQSLSLVRGFAQIALSWISVGQPNSSGFGGQADGQVSSEILGKFGMGLVLGKTVGAVNSIRDSLLKRQPKQGDKPEQSVEALKR